MSASRATGILRVGLAFALLYPPFNALLDPNSWIGYFPGFVHLPAQASGVPDIVILHVFGVVEVVLALWILSGYKIFWPSLAATLMFIVIVGFNLNQFQILFRDLSIAAIAMYLAFTNTPYRRAETSS